jgi:hypothetical protein
MAATCDKTQIGIALREVSSRHRRSLWHPAPV